MKENCLFRNITVVTTDEHEQTVSLSNVWVAVKDGSIVYVGSSENTARSQLDGVRHEQYDGSGKIMLPTLANTHGHLAMTLLRNQADDRNLHDWLFNVIFPRETRLNEHNVYVGTQLGIAEMIRSGTGAAADMYYFSDSVARAALDAGFRLNFCCDAKTPDAEGRVRVNPNLLADNINQYHMHASGLLQVSLLVHSVYLYDAALYPEPVQHGARHELPGAGSYFRNPAGTTGCTKQIWLHPDATVGKIRLFPNTDDRRPLCLC